VVVVDDLEDILDYVPIGPRFSTTVLSALRALIRQEPPKDRRRLVIATTAKREALSQLDLIDRVFDSQIPVPNITALQQLFVVLSSKGGMKEADARMAVELVASENSSISVGIKRVLKAVRVSRETEMPAEKCAEMLREAMVYSQS
jgi:vesicle-fusing ATPase